MNRRRRYLAVSAIMLSGLALKGALMGTRTVSFDSDEAIVALMAKHILAGERPVFFYGQAYMGSLDAFLIAIAYRLFGVSVFSMRIVQLALFAGVILATYHLVRRLYGDETIAQITALLVALPPPLVGLYTTVTLGGYGETLLFGTCILILGHQVTHERQDSWLHWLVLGLVAGLAFWTLPLSMVYVVPVGLAVLRRWSWRRAGRYGSALAAFLVGSSPWWGYCLHNGGACIEALVEPAAKQVVTSGWLPALGYRVLAFLFLGVPSLWGLRNPWSAEYVLSILTLPVLALYLGSIVYALRVRNPSRFLPAAMGATLVIVLSVTPFGNDATGRYLLPLYLPVALLAAELIRTLKTRNRWLASAALACLLAFNVGTTIKGALTAPAGMTAQLDARFQFGNPHDAELITFLEKEGERYGYGNFWVAYKITFLSDENIIIAPRLPFKADLSYSEDEDRYTTYTFQVADSPKPAFYITSNQPSLDDLLRLRLGEQGITYTETTIGPYRIFHDLSQHISPQALGLPLALED